MHLIEKHAILMDLSVVIEVSWLYIYLQKKKKKIGSVYLSKIILMDCTFDGVDFCYFPT